MIVEQWSLDRAAGLAAVWAETTDTAANCYAVSPEKFCRDIIVDAADDESLASSKNESLLVATEGQKALGFAHLCIGLAELDGKNVECGILRCLAFPPERREIGESLLIASESRLRPFAGGTIDAFPLYNGYAFHNHKVGILSDKLSHVVDLLTASSYTPHDGHLTLTKSLDSIDETVLPKEIDIAIEKTPGDGKLPDIRVRALHRGNRIGQCRSMSGFRYADQKHMQTLCYTRFLGVDEAFSRRGIGRHLLTRALQEMRSEGYDRTALNCRQANNRVLALYSDVGYLTLDSSSAYVKDLGK